MGEFETHFDYFMRLLESNVVPDRVPSAGECRFCNIGRPDCDDRIDAASNEDAPGNYSLNEKP